MEVALLVEKEVAMVMAVVMVVVVVVVVVMVVVVAVVVAVAAAAMVPEVVVVSRKMNANKRFQRFPSEQIQEPEM